MYDQRDHTNAHTYVRTHTHNPLSTHQPLHYTVSTACWAATQCNSLSPPLYVRTCLGPSLNTRWITKHAFQHTTDTCRRGNRAATRHTVLALFSRQVAMTTSSLWSRKEVYTHTQGTHTGHTHRAHTHTHTHTHTGHIDLAETEESMLDHASHRLHTIYALSGSTGGQLYYSYTQNDPQLVNQPLAV